MKIIIVSRIDGRIRGDIRHPMGAKSYEAAELTVAQLRDIALDPTMVIVLGEQVTDAKLAELLVTAKVDWPEITASDCTLRDLIPEPSLFLSADFARAKGFTVGRVAGAGGPGGYATPGERPSELDRPDAGAGADATQIDEQDALLKPGTLEADGGAAREISTELPNEDLAPKKRSRKPAEG